MAQRELEKQETVRGSSSFGAALLRVAWLAILLGLAMEVVLLVVAGAGGFVGAGTVVADLVKSVSWSVFVCVGLALGTTVARAQVPLMGLLGLLAAPVAFEVSRALHKGTLQALSVAGGETGDPSPMLLALVKGVEYGFLGLAVGWVGGRPWGGLMAHVSVGLLVGLIFGGAMLAFSFASAPQPVPGGELLSRGINELLFPVGCALVLFSARSLVNRVVSGD